MFFAETYQIELALYLLFTVPMMIGAYYVVFTIKGRSPLWVFVILMNPVLGWIIIAALSNAHQLESVRRTVHILQDENRMLKRQVFGLATEVTGGEVQQGVCANCRYWMEGTLNCDLYKIQLGTQCRVQTCKGFEPKAATDALS